MNKTIVVTLQTADDGSGDLVLPLTDEILEGTGISLGDTVKWIDNGDGSWTLQKEKTEWVMVECISQFRERYLVEVPKGKSEWALDTVTMNEAKEFSQHHLGETIVSHRVVTVEEALEICDVDNHYCSSWTDEQKINTFFTKDGERAEY